MDAATLVRHALEALRKPLTLKEALSSVTDFRIGRKKKHPLYEILMAAVCAMIDGAKGPTSGALRAKCPSSRQSAIQRPAGGGRETSLHWPLRCWLLVVGTLRPQAAEGKTGGPCGEPRDAQACRAERAAPRQVRVRRNQREAKGTRMGRRQAAEPHARGVEGRRNRQATNSNPRGLDARAFAEETGALENCAWNIS